MKPIDFRNETYRDLQDRLQGMRLAALRAWQLYGPGTTREIAAKARIDILTFRPRTTELCQLGLVELVEGQEGSEGHEGQYRALSDDEYRERFADCQRMAREEHAHGCQPELKLTPTR